MAQAIVAFSSLEDGRNPPSKGNSAFMAFRKSPGVVVHSALDEAGTVLAKHINHFLTSGCDSKAWERAKEALKREILKP